MRILALLAAVALLAGCSESGSDDTETTTGTNGPDGNMTGEPEVFTGSGTITASGVIFALGSGGVPFSVGANATLIFAEIAWDDPVQDITWPSQAPTPA